MNDEVLQNLAIATQFLANARYAGTPRQAVADGYSAIDAAFSALLVARGIKPLHNHKQKLEQVKAAYPDFLDTQVAHSGKGLIFSGGVSWDDVDSFYKEWLQARYERFEIPPGDARDRVMQAGRTLKFSIDAVAKVIGMPSDAVNDLVDARAFGSTDCQLYEALSAAHDHVFDEAERYGEEHGNKLARKMGSATNFAEVDLVASDNLTREIIRNDEEIARECFQLHVRMCRMMEDLRYQRYEALVKNGMSSKEARDEATAFMFALRFKYHGDKQSAHGKKLAAALAATLGGMRQADSANGEIDTDPLDDSIDEQGSAA